MTPEQTRALLAAMPAEHADLAYLLAATGAASVKRSRARWSDLGHDDAGGRCCRAQVQDGGGRARHPDHARDCATADQAARGRATRTRRADLPELRGHGARRPQLPARVQARSQGRGVPWASPHALRHGMASLMAERGYGPAQIAAHLGHADGGVLALRTYIHAERGAVDFADDALREAEGQRGEPDGEHPPRIRLQADPD